MPQWPITGKQQNKGIQTTVAITKLKSWDAKDYWTLSQISKKECLCIDADSSSFFSANIIAAQNIIKFRNKENNLRILYRKKSTFQGEVDFFLLVFALSWHINLMKISLVDMRNGFDPMYLYIYFDGSKFSKALLSPLILENYSPVSESIAAWVYGIMRDIDCQVYLQ